MKKLTLSFCLAVLFIAIGCNNPESGDKTASASADTSSASSEKPKAWVAVDSATEMKAWMEYSTPGTPHEMLARSSGEWTGQTTMWMSMGAAPVTTQSTITNKMLLGNRYQMSSFKGDFMGMPFEGMGITAYDNYQKKFISTWMDNMGTGLMKMEGAWDSASKTITYTGTMISPANGQECQMKEIYTIIDDKTEKMEMFGPDSKTGTQYKTMEIVFTRKK